jgi:hypothetical protein
MQETKRSPLNGGDDNAWKLYTFSCCFIFLQDPRHVHQPKALVTRKGCHRASKCKQWSELVEGNKEKATEGGKVTDQERCGGDQFTNLLYLASVKPTLNSPTASMREYFGVLLQ